MRVHLYCVCWNEEPLIPFFLHYYRTICEHIVVYDNQSTDNSCSLLSAAGCDVRNWVVTSDSVCEAGAAQKSTMWHESRGVADLVIVVDMDEFIMHPIGLPAYLAKCHDEGITIAEAIGYDMYHPTYPIFDGRQLHEIVTVGLLSHWCNKPCIFDPNEITKADFSTGCHGCVPYGKINWAVDRPYLLHFRHMGVDHTWNRYQALATKLLPGDHERGYGFQYKQNFDAYKHCTESNYLRAKPVLVPSGQI